ncbi:MAG: hypothetical protein R2856_26525 [Caldilineaceae bacterium]
MMRMLQRILPLLLLSVAVAMLSACTFTIAPAPVATATPDAAVDASPTATPSPAAAEPSPTTTDTPPPPTSTPTSTPMLPPTLIPTATPTPVPAPTAQRVRFAPGATAATVTGSVGMNEIDTYVLNARAGQSMEVMVDAPSGNVGLAVYGPTGVLKSVGAGSAAYWQTLLPADGDYYVDVVSTLGAFDKPYTVTFSIVTPGPATSPSETIRVRFDAGATSTTLNGSVGMNERIRYVLGAAGGQVMTVNVDAPDGNVALEISGPTGMLKPVNAGDPLAWQGVLPANGDYNVDVVSVLGAFDKPYTITFSIAFTRAAASRHRRSGENF